jgi:hypothetical protein
MFLLTRQAFFAFFTPAKRKKRPLFACFLQKKRPGL